MAYTTPGASSLKKTKAFGRNRAINPDKSFPSFLPDGDHFLFTQPVNDVATFSVADSERGHARPGAVRLARCLRLRVRSLRPPGNAARAAVRCRHAPRPASQSACWTTSSFFSDR